MKEIEINFQMSEQKFQERVDEAKVEANKVMARTHDDILQMKEGQHQYVAVGGE